MPLGPLWGPKPPTTCFRWPNKQYFRTADEASLALRMIFSKRGGRIDGTLMAYPCGDHWHHGRPKKRAEGGEDGEPKSRGPQESEGGEEGRG